MDLYVVLGLGQGATESEIKRAYRRLARRFHPDINPGDGAAAVRFRQIAEAYETLIDPEQRVRYDAGHATGAAPPRARSGFEGFDFTAQGVDHSATFGDLFAEVLTERVSRPPGSEPGADLHYELTLTFDEAFTGGPRVVTVTRRDACRSCAASGVTRTSPGSCPQCQGSGATRTVRGHMVFSRTCNGCGGTGQLRPRPCPACAGAGHITRTEPVHVHIPAGIADGTSLRLGGLGHAGVRGGQAGDLYVTVRVEPHPLFRRDGDDLHLIVPVAIHEAALGARIDIPTPQGPARLRIPPGTQSGQRLRLRERGAASLRGGGRGDLIVEVRLMLPKLLDERSKELLREFGRINGESGVRDALQSDGTARPAAVQG